MRRSLVLLCLFSLAACAPVDPVLTFLAGEETNNGTTLPTRYSGQNANIATASQRTIRSDGEWQVLWRDLQQPAPGPLPRGKMALVILLGQRPTAGYKAEIISATRDQKLGDIDRVAVNWREYRPSPAAAQAETVTSPWAILLTDSWPYAPDYHEQPAITLGG